VAHCLGAASCRSGAEMKQALTIYRDEERMRVDVAMVFFFASLKVPFLESLEKFNRKLERSCSALWEFSAAIQLRQRRGPHHDQHYFNREF
jgi:hypothetical protein